MINDMLNITGKFANFAMVVSDHGNAAVSKGIQYMGLASVGTGGGLKIAKETGAIHDETTLALADYGIIVSIIGGSLFALKVAIDIYFAILRNKREEDNHRAKQDD